MLLPALGGHPLCARIRAEHDAIRAEAAAVASADPSALRALGEYLAAHVRLEERELFPLLEEELGDAELTRLAGLCRAQEQRSEIRRA